MQMISIILISFIQFSLFEDNIKRRKDIQLEEIYDKLILDKHKSISIFTLARVIELIDTPCSLGKYNKNY